MKELAEFIRQGEQFAVLSHISPDGDTMGSAAALICGLKKLGKRAQWFCEGPVPSSYAKIPEIAALTREKPLDAIDSVICVDVSSEDRLGNCRDLFLRTVRRAQIDHHKTNTRFASVNVVRDRNAAGFAVMELLDELRVPWDDAIARALFVAIMTDTGRLSHAGVTEEDVRQTARLYAYDIRPHELISILFQEASMARTKLEGTAIAHMESALDGKVTYTYLDLPDYAACGAERSDSEGVIELCRRVEGTAFAFFLRQIPEGYKVSMRCTPGCDVAAICASFGGGGHTLAAGCTICAPREEAVALLMKKIREALA